MGTVCFVDRGHRGGRVWLFDVVDMSHEFAGLSFHVSLGMFVDVRESLQMPKLERCD